MAIYQVLLQHFLKIVTLLSLENYIRSGYFSAYPVTLYFQFQSIKVRCNVNAKNAIKMFIKKGVVVSKVIDRFESSKKKILR